MTTTPTERRLAITPGQLAHDEDGATIELLESYKSNDYHFVVADFFDPTGDGCANDNARLFLDAHNTYRACGLTPSELLAKVREADEHIRLLICEAMEWRDHCDGQVESFDGAERDMMMNCASIARQRIDKASAFLSTLSLPQ